MSDLITCGICFSPWLDPAFAPCNQHAFCCRCLLQQKESSSRMKCAICREPASYDWNPVVCVTLRKLAEVIANPSPTLVSDSETVETPVSASASSTTTTTATTNLGVVASMTTAAPPRHKESLVVTLEVPTDIMGLIIGRRGAKIQALQARTSTYIEVARRGNDPITRVFIGASRACDLEAAKMDIEGTVARILRERNVKEVARQHQTNDAAIENMSSNPVRTDESSMIHDATTNDASTPSTPTNLSPEVSNVPQTTQIMVE
jgi:KH domain